MTRGVLLAVAVAVAACASTPPPSCDIKRFKDDEETPAEASAGDACHRAGLRIAKACPELWRKDWDTWCRHLVAHDFPLCPSKLAKVSSCEEADRVCR